MGKLYILYGGIIYIYTYMVGIDEIKLYQFW